MVSVIYNFFEQNFGKWVLEESEIHFRLSEDLLKVDAAVDGRSRPT